MHLAPRLLRQADQADEGRVADQVGQAFPHRPQAAAGAAQVVPPMVLLAPQPGAQQAQQLVQHIQCQLPISCAELQGGDGREGGMPQGSAGGSGGGGGGKPGSEAAGRAT